jgi:Na+/melibiose symporter-like transporter
MTKDRELEDWRGQWLGIVGSPADLQRRVQQRIRRQNLRFALGIGFTAIAFAGMLAFAAIIRTRSELPGTGWSTAVCILVAISVGYRLWILRGAWRSSARTTRAHLELWRSRVLARIRLLRISLVVSFGWILGCVALMAANWSAFRVQLNASPGEWISALVFCILMQPVMLFGVTLLRRRNQAELEDVDIMLDQLTD